jgi:LTXXQ motif family protein
MKITPAAFALLTALLFLTALASASAQTGAVKLDAAHTLTEAQKTKLKNIREAAEKKAASAALRLAEIVKNIYNNMLAETPDEKLRLLLSGEMKEAAWTLLSIKGDSIRDMVAVLTPAQKELLKTEMRKPGAPADLSDIIEHTFNSTAK